MRNKLLVAVVLVALACGPDRPRAGGYTPLMRAAADGNVAEIRALVESGAKVNYQGRKVTRYSLLFPFTQTDTVDIPYRSWTPLIAAAAANEAESVRELLRHNARHDVAGADGPPLLVAAQRGATAAGEALLEGGADPNEGRGRAVPLTTALRARHYAFVRLLLAHNVAAPYQYDAEEALLVPLAHGDYGIIREVFAKTRLRLRRTIGAEGREIVLNAVAQGRDAAARVPISAVQDVGDDSEIIVDAIGRDDPTSVPLLDPPRDAFLLGMATAAGSPNVIAHLLARGVEPDARDREQRTALHLARDAKVLAGVEALLARGADVNATGGRLLRTPLMDAAAARNLPLMQLLVARGARVDVRDRKGWSAIRIAGGEAKSKEAVELLVRAGANRGDLQENELVAAFERGDFARVEELVRGGVSPTVATLRGGSLLSSSIRNRHRELALFLIRHGADPNFGGTDTAPLRMASVMGEESLVAALLAAKADPNLAGSINDTALLNAARHPRITRMLIAAGADVNLRPERGESPLGRAERMAADGGPDVARYAESARVLRACGATADVVRRHSLSEAAARGDVELFERLFAAASANERKRALVAAATTGKLEIARRLLDRGVTADARVDDWSALAAAAEAGHEPIAALLADRGADLNAADAQGRAPMTIAAMSGAAPIVTLLRARGAGGAPDAATLGKALIDAARDGDAAKVQQFLAAGADVNWREGRREYAKPALFVATELDRADVVRALIRGGADVNRKEKFFHTHVTPLMAASLEGAADAAQALLEAKADVHYADERGTTALSIAAGQREVNYLGKRAQFARIETRLRDAGARK